MRSYILLALLLFSSSALAVEAGKPIEAGSLAHLCGSYPQVKEAVGYCMSYINGFVLGVLAARVVQEETGAPLCTPEGDTGVIRDIFMEFVRNHPDVAKVSAATVLAFALGKRRFTSCVK
jgi:hypothetical protein